MKLVKIRKQPQWITYGYLVAGLTLTTQPVQALLHVNKQTKNPGEIRGTISLQAIYGQAASFDAAITGSDDTSHHQEAFVRMILLNRFRVTATIPDQARGGSKPVGKVTLLASRINQYELSYRITDLPADEPIVVQVVVPEELAGDAYLNDRTNVFQATGWTGIALLTADKPKLEEADFALQVVGR